MEDMQFMDLVTRYMVDFDLTEEEAVKAVERDSFYWEDDNDND